MSGSRIVSIIPTTSTLLDSGSNIQEGRSYRARDELKKGSYIVALVPCGSTDWTLLAKGSPVSDSDVAAVFLACPLADRYGERNIRCLRSLRGTPSRSRNSVLNGLGRGSLYPKLQEVTRVWAPSTTRSSWPRNAPALLIFLQCPAFRHRIMSQPATAPRVARGWVAVICFVWFASLAGGLN